MKYLVTGATGFVGNNIVRQLVDGGQEVRVLARSSSDPRPLEGLKVERMPGDVRDPAAIAAACDGAQVVIHAAGHVHLGWKQLDEHRAINVEGAKTVAVAARNAGARMVHVSGINALGLGRLKNPADENSGLPGIIEIPYVITKRESEQVVLAEVQRGLDAVIVNPGFMLGPWDWKPSSGKMLLAVTKFAPIYPVGAISACDVRDVAAGVISAATQGRKGRQYILAGHNMSYRELWRRMANVAGKRGADLADGAGFRAFAVPVLDIYSWLTGREGDANSAVLLMGRQQHCFCSRRAQDELGYTIRPFAETLADTWAWFQEWGYV